MERLGRAGEAEGGRGMKRNKGIEDARRNGAMVSERCRELRGVVGMKRGTMLWEFPDDGGCLYTSLEDGGGGRGRTAAGTER